MRKQILEIVRKALLTVAKVSASTPSQASMYQPVVPQQLKNTK